MYYESAEKRIQTKIELKSVKVIREKLYKNDRNKTMNNYKL